MPLIRPALDGDYPWVARGEGVFLYDTTGRRYLDGCSGAVTAAIGHGVPEILEAMERQARQVAFSYRLQFTNAAAEELAEAIAALTPGDVDWAFFVDSGSEAVETAQKIAVQYWRECGRPTKTVVLARSLSYHGITLGALSMSGHRSRRQNFESLLSAHSIVDPPYCYRCPTGVSYPSCGLACADDLERHIVRLGSDNIAAFAVEPVIGAAGGAIVPPSGYFRRVREICDRHDVLLIADEVMTGMGRTGRTFAIDHWGVVPDLITVGKGLSAGYTPLAAALACDKVVQAIRRGSGIIMSGHTYSANPLSCAVGLAVTRYVQEHGLIERAASVGSELGDRLRSLREAHGLVGDVRGVGLLWGLELVADEAGNPFPPHAAVAVRLVAEAKRRGLLIYPALTGASGRPGDAVLVAPPLTISPEELDLLLSLLDDALSAVEEAAEEVAGSSLAVGRPST